MECGRVGHLYSSCFNDSKVNFLLMKSCILHRVICPKGLRIKININCRRFELQQPFIAISIEAEHQLEYLQNVSSSNTEQKQKYWVF